MFIPVFKIKSYKCSGTTSAAVEVHSSVLTADNFSAATTNTIHVNKSYPTRTDFGPPMKRLMIAQPIATVSNTFTSSPTPLP